MTFLITGISSYIAQYIAQNILDNGDSVIGISRTKPSLSHSNFQWIKFDLSKGLPEFKFRIDYIIHMAALARLDKSAVEYFQSNLLLTDYVRQLAQTITPKVLFYTSSIKVYGQIKDKIVDENTPMLNPGLYGMSKSYGEKLLEEACQTISIRMPNTIAQGSYGWIDSIYKKLKNNESIHLKNSLYNHVLHPFDIYQFIHKIIKIKYYKTNQFNICSSDPITSFEVVQLMKKKLKSSSNLHTTDEANFHTLSNKKISGIFKPMSVIDTINLYLKEMQG